MIYYWQYFHWVVLFRLLLWIFLSFYISSNAFCKTNIIAHFAKRPSQACCVTIAPQGDQVLLMNNPRLCSLWNRSQVLGQWSPVALFWSCWYWFLFWLGKCHSKQQQSPCLEDLTQMNLVVCIFLKEQSDPLTFCYLEFDFHIS